IAVTTKASSLRRTAQDSRQAHMQFAGIASEHGAEALTYLPTHPPSQPATDRLVKFAAAALTGLSGSARKGGHPPGWLGGVAGTGGPRNEEGDGWLDGLIDGGVQREDGEKEA